MTDQNELSDREIEILKLVATGASNKEIAYKLSISPNTVKVHLKNIFAKIGVMSRTEAAMYAVKRGWVGESVHLNIVSEENHFRKIQSQIINISPKIRNIATIILIIFFILIMLYVITNKQSHVLSTDVEQKQLGKKEIPRWILHTNIPISIYNHVAISFEDQIILIGGCNDKEVLNTVYVFDTENEKWSEGTSLPKPLYDVGIVKIGGELFIPGGKTLDGITLNELNVFNLKNKSWRQGSALPYPVSDYGIAEFEGKLYVFGGWDGRTYYDDILRYSPDINKWDTIGKLDTSLRGLRAMSIQDGISLLGGFDGRLVYNRHQRILFSSGNIYEYREEKLPLPYPLYDFALTGTADMIFIYGGLSIDSNNNPLIHQYIYTVNEWQSFNMYQDKSYLGSAMVSYGSQIYILGGIESNSFVASNQNISFPAFYIQYIPSLR
jgi:DNA-binding CsgD family transcriptional regulator/N-acetylneuraminic acid mutarotase